jgi:cold shock CspA family protein
MNGEIIRIVAAKGFGFIHGDDGLPYFVCRSAFRGDVVFEGLCDGQRVTFEAFSTTEGPRAEDVRLAQGEDGHTREAAK